MSICRKFSGVLCLSFSKDLNCKRIKKELVQVPPHSKVGSFAKIQNQSTLIRLCCHKEWSSSQRLNHRKMFLVQAIEYHMLTGASPHLHFETQAKDGPLHPEHCHLSCERERWPWNILHQCFICLYVMVVTSTYNLLARVSYTVLPTNRGARRTILPCMWKGMGRRNHVKELENKNVVQIAVLISTTKVA